MLSQCSDFMKIWLSAEDESSIDLFSSKMVHFLIPHALLWVQKVGLHLSYSFFQMFASHSSYENPLLYCSYEEKEVGFSDSTALGQCRVQGNIPILKETQAGSEERKNLENTWKREITVSVRFLGIKLHIVSGKKLYFEIWRAPSVLQSERRSKVWL